MPIKTHKRKKSSRMHGKGQGTHGWGARKAHKGSGHRGGVGMAGTGKRADQKKTLINKLYGHDYFGKKGTKVRKEKPDAINLRDISIKLNSFLKKGIAKKTPNGYEINLSKYKILSDGELNKTHGKLIIKAKKASKLAIEKVEKLGGKVFLSPKFAKDIEQTQAMKKAGGEIVLPGKVEKTNSSQKADEVKKKTIKKNNFVRVMLT